MLLSLESAREINYDWPRDAKLITFFVKTFKSPTFSFQTIYYLYKHIFVCVKTLRKFVKSKSSAIPGFVSLLWIRPAMFAMFWGRPTIF